MEKYKEIEKDIMTTYRKSIWNKFRHAIKEYNLIQDGDKIAVCISGGKDSMLMAKCFQELKRHNKINFDVVYLVMNPGYNELNLEKIVSNAKLLNIPITIFETQIFSVVEKIDNNPCFICSKIRRGHLYNKAIELGCNKIALGHHFDDVIETILMGMMYGSQIQTMMPKLHSSYHPQMQLIRPMYYIKEADIIRWKNRNKLDFVNCACKVSEKKKLTGEDGSKREEVKELIKQLRNKYKNIDINIFRSVENVNLNAIISYKKDNKKYHFLDNYDNVNNEERKTENES